MKRSSAMTQTIVYGLGLIVMKSVSLVMLPFMTRYLTPGEYGELEILTAMVDIGTLVVGFCLAEGLFRFVGEAKTRAERDRFTASTLGLSLLLGLIIGGGAQFFAPQITAALPGGLDEIDVRLTLGSIALTGGISIPLAWLRLEERAFTFFYLTVGKTAIQASLTLYFLTHGFGVTGVMTASFISALGFAAILIALEARDAGMRIDPKHAKLLIIYCAPLVGSGIAAFGLTGFDRWFLAAELDTAALGIYAVAVKFGLIVTLLVQPYSMWWFAQRFKMLFEEGGHERAAHYTSLGLLVSILVAAAVSLTCLPLITLLVGEEFYGAIIFVPWLAIAMGLRAAGDFMNIGIHYARKTSIQMHVNVASSIAGLMIYLALIPTYGVPGAIAGLIISQMLRLMFLYHWSQRLLPLNYPFFRLAMIAILSILGILVAFQLEGFLIQMGWATLVGGTLIGLAVALDLLPEVKALLRKNKGTAVS